VEQVKEKISPYGRNDRGEVEQLRLLRCAGNDGRGQEIRRAKNMKVGRMAI